VNNKYILTATIVGMVIASTLIIYSNFSLPTAFGDHGEGFEDTYGNWYEDRDDNSNDYQPKQQQDESFEKSIK
jgi:hypothetical protein